MSESPGQRSLFDTPEPKTAAPVSLTVSQERIAEIQAAVDTQETPPLPAADLVPCAAACGRLTSPEWAELSGGKCSVCSPLDAGPFLRAKWATIIARKAVTR